jgi:hypothetical protein
LQGDSIAAAAPDDTHDSIVFVPSVYDTSFVGYISEFPPEIDGCSALYSGDLQHFDKHRFIYVSNLDSLAFMKIGGNLVRFRLTESDYAGSIPYRLYFTGGEYELIIEHKGGERIGDEVWSDFGTLLLTDRNGTVTTINFVGESGC